ncbi:hypothetical protein PQI23_08495 [Leucobacter sp. USCH14]|uniref:hypothetical protein n=1 Tax=Leucobacter sp. USCH14 TaxID=3024838 RepID=UPI0030A31F9C
MSKYPELSPFSLAFADAYRGFMREHRITGQALTEKLGRALGYVSERINGKRALDTEDVDALAMLAGSEWSGRTLMIELARRARVAVEGPGEDALPDNVVRLPQTGGAVSALDLIDDAGVVEYHGQAADRGEHEADRHSAPGEHPDD